MEECGIRGSDGLSRGGGPGARRLRWRRARGDAAAPEAAASTGTPVKAAFVYVSPVGDAGWTLAHDNARLAVDELDYVETAYTESVPEGADAERTISQYVRQGYNLIFTTSFGYMDPTITVAAGSPDVTFMHCSGFKTADNVGTYFGRMYQPRYLSGMIAGKMTESNVLGYVAAHPIPEVIRGINAFALGARAVNPDVKVHVVWTQTWYDPAKEREAAESLLDVGADVIAQHQDTPAPQQAAEKRGNYSIGYNSDMTELRSRRPSDRADLELGGDLPQGGRRGAQRHLDLLSVLGWPGRRRRRAGAVQRPGAGGRAGDGRGEEGRDRRRHVGRLHRTDQQRRRRRSG